MSDKSDKYEAINKAADRMYDAIRSYFSAEGFDAQCVAGRELQLAADSYDLAIEQLDTSKDKSA